MKRLIKARIFWYWTDIGIVFRVYKPTGHSNYHVDIDIQIAWFNLWIQLFRKRRSKNIDEQPKHFPF